MSPMSLDKLSVLQGFLHKLKFPECILDLEPAPYTFLRCSILSGTNGSLKEGGRWATNKSVYLGGLGGAEMRGGVGQNRRVGGGQTRTYTWWHIIILPCISKVTKGRAYRGPQALLLHGKSDSAARVGGVPPLGVQAGQGVPVPPGHPREVDEVVMQRLLLYTLCMHNGVGSISERGGTRSSRSLLEVV